MPDLTEIQQVRLYADEADGTNGVTDDFINQLLDDDGANLTVNAATAIVWRVKVGKAAKSMNTTTGQTRLEAKSKFEHAMLMYEMYADLAGGIEALGDAGAGDWESVEMADAGGPWPADEPQSMDAYWPGYGRQWPNVLSGTRYPLV